MTWGRMDDKFHRNRKVRELRQSKAGREALGVWVFWWSWCLDDPELLGVIPMSELPSADQKAAKMLVAVGLWDESEVGGYRIHDFHSYNPTKDQREAKLLADRARVAASRNASRENVARDSDATKTRVASTRVPIPSHPIPEEEKRDAPGGADPGTPAAKTRAKREKPKSLVALQAALVDHCNDPPALSNSLAQKACRRVTEHAERNGVTLEAAASALVLAWCQAGYVANAWKLCDVPFSVRQVSLSVVGKIREGA